MTDSKLTALVADVKKLNARVGALEKLLERILRQKPVSEKQLDRALKRGAALGQRIPARYKPECPPLPRHQARGRLRQATDNIGGEQAVRQPA